MMIFTNDINCNSRTFSKTN